MLVLVRKKCNTDKLVHSFIINIYVSRHLRTTTTKRMEAIEREIRDSIEGIIKKREKAMENGETSNEDLLSILLESNHKEIQGHGNSRAVGMTNQEVIEE